MFDSIHTPISHSVNNNNPTILSAQSSLTVFLTFLLDFFPYITFFISFSCTANTNRIFENGELRVSLWEEPLRHCTKLLCESRPPGKPRKIAAKSLTDLVVRR